MTGMPATADLRAEHGAVHRMLDIVDRMADASEAGNALNPTDLDQVVDFLRVFVDKCHHTKEETLLFPALDASGVTSVRGVVAQLLEDHSHGRENVAKIAEASQAIRHGQGPDGPALAETMRGYTALLRHHITREEEGCFDAADRELPQDVQEALEAGYDRIEVEVVGGGVHEAFHALLDRLDATDFGG